MSVRPLRRASVMVADLDRSLTLYRDVLGLTIWKEGTSRNNATFFPLLGTGPAEARFVILRVGDGDIGMLGLFEVRNPAPPVLRRTGSGINLGEVAIVFLVPRVEPLYQGIRALGLTIVCPPARFEVPGGGFTLETTFRDFDGALVNIIEQLPGGG